MGTPPRRPLLYDSFETQATTLLNRYVGSKHQMSTTNMGDNREEYLREYLTSVLPPRLTLRKGEVWDGEGNRTGQFEIIVLRDDAAALGIGKADAFLAEGVFAVIEVKSNLTTDRLDEAVRVLRKVRLLKLSPPTSLMIDSILTLSRPLCCIFSYEGAQLKTVADFLTKEENRGVVDMVSVLKRGILLGKSHLVRWEGDALFKCVPGRAAALGWLYRHLVAYSTSFLRRDLSLERYFEPTEGWADDACPHDATD